MNKKVNLVIIAVVLLLSSCINLDNQKKDVDATITSFYSKPTQDHNKVDTTLLTKGLVVLLNKAIEKEYNSAEAMTRGDVPPGKPDLIEGDIFTSLYEGSSGPVRIDKLDFQGDSAIATVSFTNNLQKVAGWKDKIVLKKEGNWKIDNVIFMGEQPAGTSTRQVLKAFASRP